MISFEFPVGEKVRNLLRVEDMFRRFAFFSAGKDPVEHHSALMALFEICEVGVRGDLRSDLLQELERQRSILEVFRGDVEVAQDVLEDVLSQIEAAVARLQELPGKLGYHLRDNEWLMTIRQRAITSGSVCEFDMPSYYYWLNRSPATRLEDLSRWADPLLPVRDAMALLLRILRGNGKTQEFTAHKGAFQQRLEGKVVHLLRLDFDDNSVAAVPELSANKYTINIRFLEPGRGDRSRSSLVMADIPFSLCYCKL